MARFLGLGYPGRPGHRPDRRRRATPRAFAFPRSLPGDGYDFSFSGLKTSVVNTVRKHPDADTADVAASFRQAVVDVLVTRARRAAADVGATALCLAGGVAANSLLRRRIEEACAEDGIGAFLPSRALCTDNAAMVAAAGWWRLQPRRGQPARPSGPTPTSVWSPPADPGSRPPVTGSGRPTVGPPGADLLALGRPGCQTPRISLSLALSTLDC